MFQVLRHAEAEGWLHVNQAEKKNPVSEKPVRSKWDFHTVKNFCHFQKPWMVSCGDCLQNRMGWSQRKGSGSYNTSQARHVEIWSLNSWQGCWCSRGLEGFHQKLGRALAIALGNLGVGRTPCCGKGAWGKGLGKNMARQSQRDLGTAQATSVDVWRTCHGCSPLAKFGFVPRLQQLCPSSSINVVVFEFPKSVSAFQGIDPHSTSSCFEVVSWCLESC